MFSSDGGIKTVSMTWITPFNASTSTSITGDRFVISMSEPSSVVAVWTSDRSVKSTVPATTQRHDGDLFALALAPAPVAEMF